MYIHHVYIDICTWTKKAGVLPTVLNSISVYGMGPPLIWHNMSKFICRMQQKDLSEYADWNRTVLKEAYAILKGTESMLRMHGFSHEEDKHNLARGILEPPAQLIDSVFENCFFVEKTPMGLEGFRQEWAKVCGLSMLMCRSILPLCMHLRSHVVACSHVPHNSDYVQMIGIRLYR